MQFNYITIMMYTQWQQLVKFLFGFPAFSNQLIRKLMRTRTYNNSRPNLINFNFPVTSSVRFIMSFFSLSSAIFIHYSFTLDAHLVCTIFVILQMHLKLNRVYLFYHIEIHFQLMDITADDVQQTTI